MGPPRFHINPRMWLSVIRAGLPFAAIQVSLTFALHFDTIVLSRHVTDSEIGLYNIAYNLVLILVNIAQSFSNAILPTLAREYASRPDSVKPWYYVSTRMMVFISLPIAIGMTALARQIITLLYQPEVLPAFITLAILAWDMPFVMYHNFCSNIAQSVQKENRAAWVAISLGVFNLLLNLLLVPQLGIIGSSFATVLTDFLGAAQYYLILRHAFGAGLGFNRLIRIVASAVLMGVLVFILHDANILVVAAVGGIFYLVIIWFSGAFSPEERARLVSMVSRRLPLRPRTA
jgi:O-antigen/teichoic acid export membrane protein